MTILETLEDAAARLDAAMREAIPDLVELGPEVKAWCPTCGQDLPEVWYHCDFDPSRADAARAIEALVTKALELGLKRFVRADTLSPRGGPVYPSARVGVATAALERLPAGALVTLFWLARRKEDVHA